MLTQDPPDERPVAEPDAPPNPPGRRATLHRAMSAKRGAVVKVHRWLSFALLAWIVVESLTGASIVFAGDLDRLFSGDDFKVTAGDVGVAQAVTAAKESRPGDLVSFISAPASGDTGGMYFVYVTDRAGDDHVVLVDPGSGAVRDADHHPPRLLGLAEELHYDLNSTSILGFAPLTILGWLGVLWLVVLLSGFYVWYWPGVKRWARALRVRRRRGRFTFHLDLHKAVGIAAFVPLVLVVVTGIQFAFPDQVRDVWNVVTFGTYRAGDVSRDLSQPQAGVRPITAEQAADAVRAVDPSLRVTYVSPPGGSPIGVYGVGARVDRSRFGLLSGQREVEVAVDQYSGRIVSVDDPADKGFSSQAYDDWSYQVHFGTFGGTTTKALWVGVGLAPAVLGATGTVMWFVRRTKRKHRTPTPGTTSNGDPA